MENVDGKAWRAIIDCMDFESDDKNFKFDFPIMIRKHSIAFIEFCKGAWQANANVMTEDQFCKMNANMPKSFFNQRVNIK